MKIGLFGDSFGTAENKDLPTAWYNLLAQRLDCELDNHSVKSSSVYYSYKKFIESYHKYDLIIFLVTAPIRYSKPLNTSIPLFEHFPMLSAVEQVKETHNNQLTDTDREILRDLEGWFMCADEEFHMDMCELMVDRISNLHNNVLFVPLSGYTYMKNNTGVNDPEETFYRFVYRQLTLLNLVPKYDLSQLILAEQSETIAAHLGPEFNAFIADVMYKGITSGVWDWSGYDNVELKYPVQYYYNWDQVKTQ